MHVRTSSVNRKAETDPSSSGCPQALEYESGSTLEAYPRV